MFLDVKIRKLWIIKINLFDNYMDLKFILKTHTTV